METISTYIYHGSVMVSLSSLDVWTITGPDTNIELSIPDQELY